MVYYKEQVILHLDPRVSKPFSSSISRRQRRTLSRIKISADRKAETPMAIKLFVGKLSYGTTSESLEALFAQYGTVVSAQVITDRDTRQSKGFAFVEMEDQAAADAAINALNDSEFEGRSIVVNVARPREDRPRDGGGNRGGFRGGNGGGGFQQRRY